MTTMMTLIRMMMLMAMTPLMILFIIIIVTIKAVRSLASSTLGGILGTYQLNQLLSERWPLFYLTRNSERSSLSLLMISRGNNDLVTSILSRCVLNFLGLCNARNA